MKIDEHKKLKRGKMLNPMICAIRMKACAGGGGGETPVTTTCCPEGMAEGKMPPKS